MKPRTNMYRAHSDKCHTIFSRAMKIAFPLLLLLFTIAGILLLIPLFIFIGSCVSNSPQSQKDPELVKRLNRANEILDGLEINFDNVISPTPASFAYSEKDDYVRRPAVRFLIENPDISLPLMFERLNSEKVPLTALCIYFLVFEKTKSVESIPFIADYIPSASREETMYFCKTLGNSFTYAIWAAEYITSLKLIDRNRPLFDQRLDIANKLNQWYEEYKKQTP